MSKQTTIVPSTTKKFSPPSRVERYLLGLWAVGAIVSLADVFIFASRHEPANALFNGIAAASFGALLGMGVCRKTT